MVDEEQLKRLRAMGVKSIEIHRDGAHFVEFYPTIPALDLDTLVPPAAGDETEVTVPAAPVPKAIANILKRGSVS